MKETKQVMSMNEIRIPIVCRITVDGAVIIIRATLIKQQDSPYILLQIEPLLN